MPHLHGACPAAFAMGSRGSSAACDCSVRQGLLLWQATQLGTMYSAVVLLPLQQVVGQTWHSMHHFAAHTGSACLVQVTRRWPRCTTQTPTVTALLSPSPRRWAWCTPAVCACRQLACRLGRQHHFCLRGTPDRQGDIPCSRCDSGCDPGMHTTRCMGAAAYVFSTQHKPSS